MEEKRENIRWRVDKKASINLCGENQMLRDCTISDISLRGARISAREKFPEIAKVFLNINNPAGIDNFEAAVIWQQEAKDSYNYGLCFNNIEESGKNRICNFVYNNFPEDVKKPLWERDTSVRTH
jgi:c-di-GMP-binding flagellar brake protein YcgR